MNLWNPYFLGGLLSLYLITGFTPPVSAEQFPQNSPLTLASEAKKQLPAPVRQQGLMNRLIVPKRQAPAKAPPAQYGYVANAPASLAGYELPLPSYLNPVDVPLSKREKRAVELSKKWLNRNVSPFLNNNGKLMYVYGSTLPTIVCSPLMGSDLELQTGEKVRDVLLGDTARWRWETTTSGEPGYEKVHIIFKATDNGLVTTAIIPTNRRVYHLKLVSNRKNYTPYVGFEYPEDQRRLLRQQVRRQQQEITQRTAPTTSGQTVDLTTLDFEYRVEGNAGWKPLQVFNDGTRTIIRFPKEASQSDLPVLLVKKAGEAAQVNYRVKKKGVHTSLIVDEIFETAMLVVGVGSQQQRVEITKLGEK